MKWQDWIRIGVFSGYLNRLDWTPVGEQLPEYRVRVLTLAPGRYFDRSIHSLRSEDGVDWWIADGDGNHTVEDGVVTHWMPLPEAAE